ncbi:Hypothetical predicted protein, partial [Olea europaea subsp. europaea]
SKIKIVKTQTNPSLLQPYLSLSTPVSRCLAQTALTPTIEAQHRAVRAHPQPPATAPSPPLFLLDLTAFTWNASGLHATAATATAIADTSHASAGDPSLLT